MYFVGKEHQISDNRHPLIFKEEFVASEIVALTSKTYVCRALDGVSIKAASKGVNKKALAARGDPFQLYKQVLDSGKANGAENRGFRAINGQMFTYRVWRMAFPYLYLKRDLVPDPNGGLAHYTRCLQNYVLRPTPKEHLSIQIDMPLLEMDNSSLQFTYASYNVSTIRQALCLAKYNYAVTFHGAMAPTNTRLKQLDTILKSADPAILRRIYDQLEETGEYSRECYNELYAIVSRRMDAHPLLYSCIDVTSHMYIVNASSEDKTWGNGHSPSVTRYRQGAFAEGGNYLGKVYMSIRKRLAQAVSLPITATY